MYTKSLSSGRRGIDLHAHTTASDGIHSPTELVRRAADAGLSAIAVTDHDTTGGIAEAVEASRAYGVDVVPGIELSAEFSGGQCHILGLLIDGENAELVRRLREVIDNRDRRNDLIAAKMRVQLGMDITIEEVQAVAGGKVIARPHFARVLVNKGYADSMQDAFDRFLAKGAKAYVERDRLEQDEAIGLIHGAGGVAILAHPNNLKLDPERTEEHIIKMKSWGLDGIEARYNRHKPEQTARYLAIAARHGLLTGAGSDFHGAAVKPNVFIGHVEYTSGDDIGIEGLALPGPPEVLEAIKAAVS